MKGGVETQDPGMRSEPLLPPMLSQINHVVINRHQASRAGWRCIIYLPEPVVQLDRAPGSHLTVYMSP